jgi:hypothetical protein
MKDIVLGSNFGGADGLFLFHNALTDALQLKYGAPPQKNDLTFAVANIGIRPDIIGL